MIPKTVKKSTLPTAMPFINKVSSSAYGNDLRKVVQQVSHPSIVNVSAKVDRRTVIPPCRAIGTSVLIETMMPDIHECQFYKFHELIV